MTSQDLATPEHIESFIVILRGQKVILDRDLATLYGVMTRNLNKAVTRNLDRFPADFMFQLAKDEVTNLMFQSGTSSWGGTRKLPRAFTEQGVAMLSSVLNSPRAAQVNIEIMRAFVRIRQMRQTNTELARKLAAGGRELGVGQRRVRRRGHASVDLGRLPAARSEDAGREILRLVGTRSISRISVAPAAQPPPVKVAVHVPATHATPVGAGPAHCPQVTPPQPAHSSFVFGPSPSTAQQRSIWQWILVMAVGHEQHASIDVASVQSSAVWQTSTSGDGQNGQQNPGPRMGGPCGHSAAGHVIPAQLQTGH